MADWKTYAKAARNTARKQAPAAKDAARRASDRAGDYVRAAGKAIDEGRRDDAPHRPDEQDRPRRERGERDEHRGDDGNDEHRPDEGSDRDRRPAPPRERSAADAPPTATAQRPALDSDRLRKDAAAYYTVASRRVTSAGLIPRVMRALRDALLIGLSLFVIWGVLYVAGIPIPFTTVVIVVLLIVVASFGSGLYAQSRRAREAQAAPEAQTHPES